METPGPDQRITVSLSTLRAELGSLELRLVDRMNGALANKADRAILDQVVARQADGLSRLSILETRAIVRDGPVVHEIEEHAKQLTNLQAISGYKRWLWAQTFALCGIAAAVVGIWIQAGPK